MNLSKAKLAYIRSLKDKKQRNQHAVFVAESNKLVAELLTCMKCQLLIATEDFLNNLDIKEASVEEIICVSDKELSQASTLKTPQQALAIFYQVNPNPNFNLSKELCLALDGIQDPGNMGTIIRLADWYGINHMFCSLDTVDIYNSKVVQASMGALARVNIHYLNLADFLSENPNIPLYGTTLDGKNIYQKNLSSNGIIVMGNEGNGISSEVRQYITDNLFIPNYPIGFATSESLNVAISAAIVCAEFRRREFS